MQFRIEPYISFTTKLVFSVLSFRWFPNELSKWTYKISNFQQNESRNQRHFHVLFEIAFTFWNQLPPFQNATFGHCFFLCWKLLGVSIFRIYHWTLNIFPMQVVILTKHWDDKREMRNLVLVSFGLQRVELSSKYGPCSPGGICWQGGVVVTPQGIPRVVFRSWTLLVELTFVHLLLIADEVVVRTIVLVFLCWFGVVYFSKDWTFGTGGCPWCADSHGVLH